MDRFSFDIGANGKTKKSYFVLVSIHH